MITNLVSFLDHIKDLEKQNFELLTLLKQIVAQEEKRFLDEWRAADRVNNSDGVGVRFDYVPYPKHPKWFSDACALITKFEEAK